MNTQMFNNPVRTGHPGGQCSTNPSERQPERFILAGFIRAGNFQLKYN